MSSLIPEGAGIILGVGVGAAASAAIEPAVEIPKQEAWDRNRNRLLDAAVMARLVAQGAIDLSTGQNSAHREGFSDDKFDHLVYLSQTVPGIGEATDLWRKGLLAPDLYTHALTKSGLDQRYVAPIVANKTAQLVGLGDIAYAIVRGLLPAPSWVPVAAPTSGTTVPRFPMVPLDPIKLAEKLGFDENMLHLMVGRSGLSMAPVMAANAYFRQIINYEDALLAGAEGDLRTEWMPYVIDTARQILTAHDYAELQLRGYLNQAQRRAGTAKHGMSPADSDLLYDVLGRGLSLHQAFIGIRRGGSLNGPTGQIPPWALYQLQRGNLRPEVYNLAWAAHETYPSAFVFRQLLKDGALTETEGRDYFLGMGWPQTLAEKAAAAYAVTTGPTADPHVAKAQSHLWSTVQTRYIAAEPGDVDPTAAFDQLGVPAGVRGEITALWDTARGYTSKRLTATQVKKAYRGGVTNPDTGAPWTLDEATAELISLGYSPDDAQTFLEI